MEQRRNTIREYITRHGEATIDQLTELLPGFSAMTIRRDLDFLEEQGVLIRTHGGARLVQAAREDLYGLREAVNIDAKEIIARKAAPLISAGHAIYIDAGTTCMAFARAMPETGAPVITNGANIAIEISIRCRNTPVSLLGGQLSPLSLAVSGSPAVEHLSKLNIDTAVMSASGFTPEAGFTNGLLQESELKRTVIAKSRRVILLMDDSKFNRNLPYTFARAPDIDIFVCNTSPPEPQRYFFEEAGVQLL